MRIFGFGLSTSESWFCDEREDTSDTITTALIGEVCCVFWFDLFDALLVVNLKTGDEAGIWSTGTCKYTKVRLGCCCDTAWQINTCVNLKLNLLFCCENAIDGLNAIVGAAFAVVYVCRSRNLPAVL